MNRFIPAIPVILLGLLVFASCELRNPLEPDLPNNRLGNIPPETHLFLPDTTRSFADTTVVHIDTTVTDSGTFYDTTAMDITYWTGAREAFVPDTTQSKKSISWWGDDVDGEVTYYEYKWNFQADWTVDSSETDTFYLPIRTAFDEFIFEVRAIDNGGAKDPSPARLKFPVFNSSPTIEFVLNSNPGAVNPEVDTAVTFPTRTFLWNALDPDGAETIVSIDYFLADGSLADTSLTASTPWESLDPEVDRVTLENLAAGPHTFFVRAQDIAGAFSDTIQFPDPESDSEPHTWVVKEPVGDVCLINDYPLELSVETKYKDWLNTAVGSDNYSVWRIGSPQWHPENSLPYAPEDVEATLNYFDKVIWYQYSGLPHYPDADLGINKYLAGGGNMILTVVELDTSAVFVHIDSMFTINPQGRFFNDEEIVSTVDSAAYTLTNPNLIGKRMKGLIPRLSARVDFHLNQNGNPSWNGTPAVGLLDRIGGAGGGKLLLLSVPLHLLNGRDNMPDVLDYYLNNEFEQP